MLGPQDSRSRAYYDSFAERYDDPRGGSEPGGYHDLIDDLEVEIVERFGRGADLLEVGCGTGLLLERFARFARSAKGIDLSPGMLARARDRGLEVAEASATELPFEDASFDLVCSFKVLPHVPDIDRAISEMFRVTRPGGFVVAEFYNPRSVRALAKRIAGARPVAEGVREDAVHTRFDTPEQAARRAPPGARVVTVRGIRILTPAAAALRVPVVGRMLVRAEHLLADGPLARFGGFYVVVWQKPS